MNILIITHFFPPLNEIASLRIYYFAKYWSTKNNVFVLTTKKYSSDGYLDLQTSNKEFEIFEIDYLPLFFWTNKDVVKTKSSKLVTEKNSFKKFLANIYFKSSALLDQQYLWVAKAVKKGRKIIKEKNIDIIFSTYSPSSAHITASILKREFPNLFWAADYRDLWSQNHMLKKYEVVKWLEKKIELKTLNSVDLITTVSDPLKALQEKFLQKKVFVVENGFEGEIYEENQQSNIKKNNYRIIHTGTIYQGFRDPSPLFIALNQLEAECKIKPGQVCIEFYGNRLGNLTELIKENKAEKWAKVKGYRSRTEILEIQKGSDFLLLLESNKEESKGVLTGKLFEYIFTGIPIISIGLDIEASASKLISKTGTGVNCGTDLKKIKELIFSLSNGGFLQEFNPKKQEILKYTRKNLSERYLELVKENLKNK